MIHDPDLLDRLSGLPIERFDGEAFRATRANLHPLAFSTRGGRWAPQDRVAVLYTSLAREGALAEIAHHWGRLTPRPTKPAVLHRLRVATQRTVRLLRADLPTWDIDLQATVELRHRRTQEIGAAVAFLDCDGLIAPSARWDCDNLILFGENRSGSMLEIAESEEVDWIGWGSAVGVLDDRA